MKIERGIVMTLLLALCACSSDSNPTSKSSGAALDGEQLYSGQNCKICHGPGGQGLPGMGPALRDIDELWTVDKMAEYLGNPAEYAKKDPRLAHDSKYRMKMPNSALSLEARKVLAEYVIGL